MAFTAEQKRAYRAKRKDEGRPVKGGGNAGRRKKSKSNFFKLKFLAWDGEGIGHPKNRYVMLANSDRESITADDLCTTEILEYLLDRDRKGLIHVIYGGSYDFTHWIMSLNDEEKTELWTKGEIVWNDYKIEMTPHKSFTVRDWKKTRDKEKGRKVTVWDVIGFFQSSFLSTIGAWDIGTKEERKFVERMKASRGVFKQEDSEEIARYNYLECELLRGLMEKLHKLLCEDPNADRDADEHTKPWLPLKRWDGAGAVAAAIYQKEGVKVHVGNSTRWVKTFKDVERSKQWHYGDVAEQHKVEFALRCAYFGGRIECFQKGRANAPGWDLDVVSAYPYMMLSLPSFETGVWKEVTTFDPDAFGVWETDWSNEDHTIYPLPYRSRSGVVDFPRQGRGWHHTCEVRSAMADPRNHITVRRGYVWQTDSQVKPFEFVRPYFNQRKILKSSGHPAEKIIKLGLNSLYGKMAQTVGSEMQPREVDFEIPVASVEGSIDEWIKKVSANKIFYTTPPYYNLAWAGAVTAGCRSMVYDMAMTRESDVVMIQTDGLFGLGETPKVEQTKELGTFEIVEYDDIICVQAGVYWLGKEGATNDIEWKVTKTRGFSRADVSPDICLEAWKKRLTEVKYKGSPRFYTLGAALGSGMDKLGHWIQGERRLDMYRDSKRYVSHDTKKRLDLRMYPAKNHLNADFELHGFPSRPTDPKWKFEDDSKAAEEIRFQMNTEPMIEGADYVDNILGPLAAMRERKWTPPAEDVGGLTEDDI
jgi:hypothetical protein